MQPHLLKLLVSKLELKTYIKGQLICHQGQQPTHLYIVKSGEFEIYRTRAQKPSSIDDPGQKEQLRCPDGRAIVCDSDAVLRGPKAPG